MIAEQYLLVFFVNH